MSRPYRVRPSAPTPYLRRNDAEVFTAGDWGMRATDFSVRLTPIQSFVERCCDPSVESPNLPLELDLADYVNTKRANTAREAVFEVVNKINARAPHVGMLGLHLLDILVKNCGFPVHLQIATKEFLNELVRRFPERPPMHPSPVMSKILEMIHEWRQTLCVTSKNREDLVHIRDMHRLLMYKGYRFPKTDARSAAVLNNETSLQTPQELEEETRVAQGAKLQELIRRGTPRDLRQAQELMKVMSGADPDAAEPTLQIAKELDKLRSRVKLLNDMLDQAKPSEKFVSGDAYDQVSSHLRSVQPRLQKWVSQAEESDSEMLIQFLETNDTINQTLYRYDSTVQGNGSVSAPKSGKGRLDLISFDEEEAPDPAASAQKAPSFMDDLALLSTLNSSASASAPAPAPARAPTQGKNAVADLLGDLDEPSTPPIALGSTPVPAPSADPFAALDLLR